MEPHQAVDAPLTVALAAAAGMIVQSLSRHLRLPGIVLLLAAGVVLGPDILGVVLPETMGSALQILVGFAVAVILFEGGLNLNLRRILREAAVIQRLLTLGALITAVGGALAARFLMGWDWTLSILFGTLVIVTGPTVITPLLRRIKVSHKVETVLEAEGVLIDPVGAVIAVVALQVAVHPSGSTLAAGTVTFLQSLGAGLALGVAGGGLLALLLRFRKVVPEGLENVFTLSLVMALYQTSDFFVPESGIMAVTAAGMVVGNLRTHMQRDLLEFKEQLTVLFIGMLFVLLAADVRLAEVQALGWPGLATVAALMFVVRPVNIWASTTGSGLNLREKTFLSWLAPRGIVAAAMASLFAQDLELAGIAGGGSLRALVFLVIASTVLLQGLSGGLVARVLGLRRPAHRGYAILGANEIGHAIGQVLRDAGEEVVFLDSNPAQCKVVEQDDFKVIYGSAIEERTLQRAQLDDRAACVAVTQNSEVNLLFARTAAQDFKVNKVFVALERGQSRVTAESVKKAHGNVLLGVPRDLELWSLRMRRQLAGVEAWRKASNPPVADEEAADEPEFFQVPKSLMLPLVVRRGDKTTPVHSGQPFKTGDEVYFAVFEGHRAEARERLEHQGWEPVAAKQESEVLSPGVP